MAQNKSTASMASSLYGAAANGDTATLTRLLDNGVSPNTRADWQETALHAAAAQNQVECVRILLNHPAIAPNMLSIEGNTPLLKAIEYGATDCMCILAATPSVDVRKGNQNPLMRALYWGHVACATQLLQRNSIQSAQEALTALTIAAENGNADCLKATLTASEVYFDKLTASNDECVTPFYSALNAGHAECCTLILQSPLSAHVPPMLRLLFTGDTPAMQAGISARTVQEFRSEQQQTLLHLAAMHNLVPAMQHVLNIAPNLLNAEDANGCTPLHLAANFGRTAAMQELLQADGIDINHRNDRKETALHSATWNGHAGCVQLLVQAGADANIPDVEDGVPLYWAAYWGRVDCLRFLLMAQGIDVNLAHESGETALHIAAAKGKRECLELLLQEPGILLNIKDAQGFTPLRRATLKNQTACATLLKKAMQR